MNFLTHEKKDLKAGPPERNLVLIMAVVGVSILVMIGIWQLQTQLPKPQEQITPTPLSEPPRVINQWSALSRDNLPDVFPSDLPLGNSIKIANVFKMRFINGGSQYLVQLQSGKSPADNFNLYKKYFQQSDWIIKSEQHQKSFDEISAIKTNDNKLLAVVVNRQIKNSESQITLTLIAP